MANNISGRNFTETNTHTRETYSGGLLIELFENPRNALQVYYELLNRGYKKEDITLMMTEETEKTYFSNQNISKTEPGTKVLEGMGLGSAVGGTTGAIVAGLATLGTSLIIPGMGIVIAGAIAAALAGAGAGAVAGGLVGALIGLGVPNELAKEFETGIKTGGVVIGVYTKSPAEYEQLKNQWRLFKTREDFIA